MPVGKIRVNIAAKRETSMIHPILKMGDPRLLRVAKPVEHFGTADLQTLIADMFETMEDAGGVGLAAPQIGVDLQLVIFGFDHSDRYPDAPPVPRTILLNPAIEPLSPHKEEGWEGCLSVPGIFDSLSGVFGNNLRPVARTLDACLRRMSRFPSDVLDDLSRLGCTLVHIVSSVLAKGHSYAENQDH